MSESVSESQKAVIGCILFDGNDAMAKCVAAGVGADWFTGTERRAWKIMYGVFQTGKYIDPVKFVDMAGESKDCGISVKYVTDIQDAVFPSNLHVYLEMLESEYLQRVAAYQAEETLRRVKAATKDDIRETIASVQAEWAKCGKSRAIDEKPMHEVATEVIEGWERPAVPKDCVLWPLDEMNKVMAPITDEFIIVGARQSVGKTAFALQISVFNGLNGVTTSLASMESKKPKIAMRMISHIAQVNTLRLRRKENTPQEMQQAKDSVAKIKALTFSVIDIGMSVEQIRAWSIAEKAKGSRLIILDNFKHIRPSRRYSSPVEQFRDISMQLKWIRDDVGIAMMVLHHLNKDGDLSWSDDIWRDADIVMTLKDAEEQPPEQTPEERQAVGHRSFTLVDIVMEKDRDGQKNLAFQVEFHTQVQTFESRPTEQGCSNYDHES